MHHYVHHIHAHARTCARAVWLFLDLQIHVQEMNLVAFQIGQFRSLVLYTIMCIASD